MFGLPLFFVPICLDVAAWANSLPQTSGFWTVGILMSINPLLRQEFARFVFGAWGAVAMAAGLAVVAGPCMAQSSEPTEIRAQISPRQHAVLSSEMAGRIVELSVREGDSFEKGQKLVVFDCAVQVAKSAQAQAAEQAAAKKLDVASRLDKLQSISGMELAQAESARIVARAEVALNRALSDRCSIVAPFDGRVAARAVQRWEFVAEGKELLDIYETTAFELEMLVPSHWLRWMKPGQAFSLVIDETGQAYTAELTRFGARIDPVSQSIKVFGRIKGKADGLLPGMSGTVLIPNPTSAPQQ
jgi:membrane fusion protein, multidrug efflux system